jgi:methyl-accepting chemotaxis protein
MNLSFNRIITHTSVRARIIVLAAIPVLGFLVNGVAYTVGEQEVAGAFSNARDASDLAAISREFRAKLAQMQVRARDFIMHPSQDDIQGFDAIHKVADQTLASIEVAADQSTRDMIAPLKSELREIATQFDDLARNQKMLGFTETDGIRDKMKKAGIAVERIIHEDISWMSEGDAHKLLYSLLSMRRFEAEYRLARSTLIQTSFFDEFHKFQTALTGIVAAEVLKQQLAGQVKAYSDTFAQWIDYTDKVTPPVAIIEFNVKNMIPIADEIISSAKSHTNTAAAALASSQKRTRMIIAGVGVATVVIGLWLSWLIGRSIARPLNGLADVMARLADGDTSARIPATRAGDEIGAMARTVIVFRDNMIEPASPGQPAQYGQSARTLFDQAQ